MSWDGWLRTELDAVRAAGRWRELRTLRGPGPRHRTVDGREVVSFASNDYLGLASHPAVLEAAAEEARRSGTGAGSSRLIVGDRPVHHQLEEGLARWRRTDAALVLASGYQANLALLTTLGAGARIVSDELNHASIIDGARLARAEVVVYAHGDVEQAGKLLSEAPGRALLVTDTVFSMDGDAAPVDALADACRRHRAILVLDDAHAVLGASASSPASELPGVCLRVGTLSKALGSQGGFITGPTPWIDLLVNKGRPFIFTTGLAPPAAAAALAALNIVQSPEGQALEETLRRHIDRIRPGHPSPIIPLVLGGEQEALALSARLLDEGFFIPAIRPPTVPAGTSRLRISLSAAHSDEEVDGLAGLLVGLGVGG